MDNIKELHELCETVTEAIRQANEKIRQAGGQLTGDDVSYIDKLTHALKSIKATIAMMEEDDGYSGDGYSRSRSYARGGRMRSSRNGYPSDGYSRRGDLAEQLRDLMQDAPDDRTQQELKRLIDRL